MVSSMIDQSYYVNVILFLIPKSRCPIGHLLFGAVDGTRCQFIS